MGKRAARVAGFVLSASIALSIGGNAAAQEIMCQDAVEKAWSEAGVDRTDVRETLAVRQTGNNSGRADSNIYTRFESCSGALIVHVDKHCFVRQVYTIGDCSLPGVSAYP